MGRLRSNAVLGSSVRPGLRRPAGPVPRAPRSIEVKGWASVGDGALIPNEWINAQRFGEPYWLYLLVNCKTRRELNLIQDPADKLVPGEETSVVRYMIGQQDWRNAAITGAPTP